MKSFSLQSKSAKTSVLVWSVFLGFLIDTILEFIFFGRIWDCGDAVDSLKCYQKVNEVFFPLGYGYFYGLIFWVLIVLIFLSLIKYFKNKKSNAANS